MALYVIPVPQPAAGADWKTTVPGQYLYDVTGITATLTTSGSLSIMADSSGNGNNANYLNRSGYPIPHAGLVAGDGAQQFGPLDGSSLNPQSGGSFPTLGIDWGGPFTIEWWVQIVAGAPNVELFQFPQGNPVALANLVDIQISGMGDPSSLLVAVQHAGAGPVYNYTFPTDGHIHHVVAVFDGAGTWSVYIDAVLQTPTSFAGFGAIPSPSHFNGWLTQQFASGGDCLDGVLDEIALYGTALSSARITAHYNAAAVSFAAYTAAVLADSPNAYYHLDDAAVGPQRQVDLQITDGTHLVEEIPTGFGESSTAAPYLYSWQPNLNSSTETPDGTITTVAIPPLILPAGYTIGTHTLDLNAGDQWSNVFVWWDDSFQNALNPYTPYAYPPGAFLQYQQQGAIP